MRTIALVEISRSGLTEIEQFTNDDLALRYAIREAERILHGELNEMVSQIAAHRAEGDSVRVQHITERRRAVQETITASRKRGLTRQERFDTLRDVLDADDNIVVSERVLWNELLDIGDANVQGESA